MLVSVVAIPVVIKEDTLTCGRWAHDVVFVITRQSDACQAQECQAQECQAQECQAQDCLLSCLQLLLALYCFHPLLHLVKPCGKDGIVPQGTCQQPP
jgi:hypothetical protein